MVLRGILAAVFGTVLMTLSSETEASLTGRKPSQAPGKAVGTILSALGGPPLEGKALAAVSTWGHWVYGAAWGIVFWGLADPKLLGLGPAAAAPLFGAVVWIVAQIHQPLLGVSRPIWQYGRRALAIDLWHHAVYAGGTAIGWWLIGQAVSGLTFLQSGQATNTVG